MPLFSKSCYLVNEDTAEFGKKSLHSLASYDMIAAMAPIHECRFPEVIIGKDDEEGILKKDMRVLTPCPTCGETPLDHLDFLQHHSDEAGDALLNAQEDRPLYHWSPHSRRKQILRYGLLPHRRATTSSVIIHPVICLADSPSWAWALSGGMRYTPCGEWDLWETSVERIEEPVVLPGRGRRSGLYEVRTEHRIWKRNIWHVGTKVKRAK